MDIENLKSFERMFVNQQLSRFEKASLDDKKKIYTDIKKNNSLSNVDVFLIKGYGNILSKETEIDLDSIDIELKNFELKGVNKIAKMINSSADFCLLGGIILGIWLGGYYVDYSSYSISSEWGIFANLSVTIAWVIIGAVSYISLKALSEIIQLLHDIRNNTSKDI